MQPSLSAAVRQVVSTLEQAGYRYALIGGLALAHWGVLRGTRDVDVKLLVPDTDYTAVRDALRTLFPDADRSEDPPNPLIVPVSVLGIGVDFLLALPGYEEELVLRAKRYDLGGWQAAICSIEDLLIQKVVAGRPKDWLDVQALLMVHAGSVDHSFVRGWLAEFASALDDPSIVIRYEQTLVETAAGPAATPPPSRP